MAGKSVPFSARLSPQDAEFIAQFQVEGAHSPSDKIRAIIADARDRSTGAGDYKSALQQTQSMIAPTLRLTRSSERSAGSHSELVSRLGDWVPECLAYFASWTGAEAELSAEELTRLEVGLVQRSVTLMESILQMAITQRSPCYDPVLLNEKISPVLELARIISTTRTQA